jgi:thiol-disulfide isomerase/thioredoxin
MLVGNHRIAERIVLVIIFDDRARQLGAFLDPQPLRQRTRGDVAHDDLDRHDFDLTNELFARSKYTLVDFWGVWCAPCVWEMPVLHKAYDRFRERGFTILSLSTDASVATVEKFRQEKWKMPWINGWMGPQGNDSPALTTLGVMEFPLAVLVDSAGRIVAVTEGLRGGGLEVTLGKLLR